jgi:hypothetical protein
VARIISSYGCGLVQTCEMKSNLGIVPDGYLIFNSKTNVGSISVAMKPNIDLFYHGDWLNEMLKPLTDKGFNRFSQ